MMRVVFVNHSHPAMPHVSGQRAWRFAQELAKRGHQVILICEWREGAPPAPDADHMADLLAGHDWSQPLIVAVKPSPVPLLERVRSPRTATFTRKALVVRSYLSASGMFTDFSGAAEQYLPVLAQAFKPQAVWGIFGNTDCWLIAQRLAQLAACGWAGDMKDAWDWWIPSGLRNVLARRFRDMAAGTANAEFHAESFARWFPTRPAVVYSGVDDEWIHAAIEPLEDFRVMLVGGLYGKDDFARWMAGFQSWLRTKSEDDRRQISFCYAGSDSARVMPAAQGLEGLIGVDVRGYVPLPELAALCKGSAVNAYLWSSTTFHHKLIELLCCRRPIISFPGERDESVRLAKDTGGSLNVCATGDDLQSAWEAIWQGGRQPLSGTEELRHLTWAAQANRLEAVLRDVAREPAA
jgi:hypothetical protein